MAGLTTLAGGVLTMLALAALVYVAAVLLVAAFSPPAEHAVSRFDDSEWGGR